MPLGFEDATPLDISGDPKPTQPLTQKQMAGAMNRNVNRTQLGPHPAGKGISPGQPQANGQAEKKPGAEQDQSQAEAQSQVAQPSTGIGPAWQQVHDGVANLVNDPEWHEHPLFRWLIPQSADPRELAQNTWAAGQWWGRVINALIDPNAIYASFSNIAHDNSLGGQIKQHLFSIHDDPVQEFLWNVPTYGLMLMSEWEPWMWGPSLAAQGPPQLGQLPGVMMSLFGNDLRHPQFADPDWYARVGTYALSALLVSKGGGRAAAPLLKYSGRLKLFTPFVEKADRLLGGPGSKTEIKLPVQGPDGQKYDPNDDPEGHAAAVWWNDNVEPLPEARSEIGPRPEKPAETYIYQQVPIEGLPGEYAERKVPVRGDPQALPDLAQKLGLTRNSTRQEVQSKLAMLVENRELSPRLSGQILKEWNRYGPALDLWSKIRYYSAAEAPFRGVDVSAANLPEGDAQALASDAMRAANGFHADVMSGVHAYGNELLEALTKGILSHSRVAHAYGTEMAQAAERMLTKAGTGGPGRLAKADTELRSAISRAIESPEPREAQQMEENLADARKRGDFFGVQRYTDELERLEQEGHRLYDDLPPQGKFVLDLYRRMEAFLRDRKLATGYPGFRPEPNYFRRVPMDTSNLEVVLKGVDKKVREAARSAASRSPFAHMRHEHRAIRLTGMDEKGLIAQTAYKTTAEANAQRALWRQQIKDDLLKQAEKNADLRKVVSDPAKLDALAKAEIPDFSTDIIDAFKAMLRDYQDLYTHEVMETVKRTLVKDDRDGRWHPLAVSRNEAGQEASTTLSDHFKFLHGADSTTDFYSRQMGYRAVEGLQYGGYIFHPGLANPINSLNHLHDADGIYAALRKLAGGGKHLIMLNPMWHANNMAGRFAWLAGMHPQEVASSLLKANGAGDLTKEQAMHWFDAQEREYFQHGGVTPQLNEDVVNNIGRQHTLNTGDIEVGEPMDVKEPVGGFYLPTVADAWGAVKGVDAWYQQSINDHFWHKYRQFGTLAYIVLKKDALERGMSPGDARLYAASQANRMAGMVSPDRWAQNPFMYKMSQLALFAPNWWRTFPGIVLQSYDRMGLKTSPALSNAWALNTAKAVGAMALTKMASDNLLNWLMSGHWQFQNDDGYKNQVTMDRFFPTDPKTGAHTVMENPWERQPTDLERALGLSEAMKQGYWKPEFAYQGAGETALARVSPLVDAIEIGANLDLYGSFKNRAWRWVDPSHPYPVGGPNNWIASLAAFSPAAFAAQAAVQGTTAAPGTINWGPFKGTTLPGWVMRLLNPNEPASDVLSLLGIRGGYPSPVRSPGAGLSSRDLDNLTQEQNSWNGWLQKQQKDVMSGGETWADFAHKYRQQAAIHAGTIQGITKNSSDYEKGASGLLTKYEAIYNDPKAFDQNGDINWAYVDKAQGELQAQTDPATWRQMIALKDKTAMQYPVLRAYKDSLQNYRNFQDTEARKLGIDGESLRAQIAESARSPDFRKYEASHPALAQFYAARRRWELETKQGFAYGLFTNNSYVMRVVAPQGTAQEAEAAEQKILPDIEQMEQAGQFVTPSGQ